MFGWWKIVLKILFTSSSGGHLQELMQLKKIITQHESYLFTENNSNSDLNFKKVISVRQINRKEKWFIWHFCKLIFKSLKTYKNIRPQIIISTGALVTVPICIIGKLLNSKVIYIESFARIYTPSLTGKIMYRFADVFIVQWEELLNYFPRAQYFGGIF